MVDRLLDIKRRFPKILDIGAGPGFIAKHLDMEITQNLVMTDSSSQLPPPIPSLTTLDNDPLFSQKLCSTAISTSKQKVSLFLTLYVLRAVIHELPTQSQSNE